MARKIWCLFSVENNYNQPDHNLVCWWPEKPSSPQTIAYALGIDLNPKVLAYYAEQFQAILNGDSTRIITTDYSISQVEEGVPLTCQQL